MDKRARNILILLGLALLAIIITEIARPKPINWNRSYTAVDKIPFGCHVLFKELQESKKFIKTVALVTKNPYEFLSDSTYSQNSTYIFINSKVSLDKRSYEKLIEYVRDGNTAFIAGTDFGEIFKDSLNIETITNYDLTEEVIKPAFFSPDIRLDSLPSLKKGIYKTHFKSFDTTKTTALGYYKNEEVALEHVNFIKIAEGKGAIFLNTLPEAFSNYYMLHGTDAYVAANFSFLENSNYYWDEYLKDGRKIIESPMRFVLNQAPLRWAYYVLIIGLLIFLIFKGKREQRVIPVIKPLENTSIEFTKTIGDLYFQHKDYENIISKKIIYFLEKIRSQYYINTNELDTTFINSLSLKTNHSLEETKNLVEYIQYLKGKPIQIEADLITLNKKIEAFTL